MLVLWIDDDHSLSVRLFGGGRGFYLSTCHYCACFGLPKHIQTLRWTLTTFFLCRFCGRTC
jgi:hypothetical protein